MQLNTVQISLRYRIGSSKSRISRQTLLESAELSDTVLYLPDLVHGFLHGGDSTALATRQRYINSGCPISTE